MMKPTIGLRGRQIALSMCEALGVEFREMTGRRQSRRSTVARHAIMSALKDAGYGNHAIGKLLCKDPSTVSTGARDHRLRMLWIEALKAAAVPFSEVCDRYAQAMRRAA